MSYTVDLIVGSLPADDKLAWAAIEKLRESYYRDQREKAPALVALHDQLTARYRCLSSYRDDEPADECPWADGPMINNFARDMGMLAISFSRATEVVAFIIEKANALGITVADGQSGEIFRPGGNPTTKRGPWWQLWKRL